MNVIIHNYRNCKYLINTNNISCASFYPADPDSYAKVMEEYGGPLMFIDIDWHYGLSTTILVKPEVAEEFLKLYESAVEIF